jgi:hypothetical protein
LNFSNNQQISSSLSDSIQLTLLTGQKFTKFTYQPICAKAPVSPEVKLGILNHSLFSWPYDNSGDEFGINSKFYSITSNGIINFSNSNGAVELELLDGQQVQVDYTMLLSANGHQVPSGQNTQIATSFLVNIASQSPTSSLDDSLSNLAIITSTVEMPVVQHRFVSQDVCPNFSFPNGLMTADYGIALCTLDFTANGNISVRF